MFLLLIFVNCACKKGEIIKLNIPLDSMINYSNNLTSLILNHDKLLLFTYDGNCGYCVNKLRLCDSLYRVNRKEYNNINCLAILSTKDKYILEYHLEMLNITIPIFIDTSSLFLSSNNITNNNTCFVLDSSNNVVFKGDYLKSTKRFSRIVKNMNERKFVTSLPF